MPAMPITQDDWISIGPNRYLVMARMPWGTTERAEVLVVAEHGWEARHESRDPRWSAFRVGPVVIAIRFDATRVSAAEPQKAAFRDRAAVALCCAGR